MGVAPVATFVAVLLALSSRATPASTEAPSEASASTLARLLLGTIESCSSDDDQMWACLSQRAERLAERVLRLRRIPIVEGVSLERTSRGDKRSVESGDPLARMLESFSLQVTPPAVLTDRTLFRDAVEKGRGKLKKYLKPLLLIASTIKAYLFMAAVATLAAIAGKALLVGKLALVLALTAAYKNYISPKKETTVEVVKVPHVSHAHKSHHHHSSSGGGHDHHHQQQHYSSHEWEGSYGTEEGGGGGGDYYDKRRHDKDQLGAAAAVTSDLAYRGYRQDENGMWSRRDDGAEWKGEEEVGVVGREERSAPWRAVTGMRDGAIPLYKSSSTTWK